MAEFLEVEEGKNMVTLNLKFTVLPFWPNYRQWGACQGALVVKNSPTNAGGIRDAISIPGFRSTGHAGANGKLTFEGSKIEFRRLNNEFYRMLTFEGEQGRISKI